MTEEQKLNRTRLALADLIGEIEDFVLNIDALESDLEEQIRNARATLSETAPNEALSARTVL